MKEPRAAAPRMGRVRQFCQLFINFWLNQVKALPRAGRAGLRPPKELALLWSVIGRRALVIALIKALCAPLG